jgi:dienelactone hydrolase
VQANTRGHAQCSGCAHAFGPTLAALTQRKVKALNLEPIVYDCSGTRLTGYLAMPATNTPVPGVLVAHDASGVNDHIKSRAAALAELGYAAFALDLYGVEGFPRDETLARHTELVDSYGLLVKRARAGLRTLATQPRVDPSRLAAIGFCQGGVTALELARAGEPILAAIGFHPGYLRSNGSPDGPITARVLMMSGTEDPYASPEQFATFSREMSAKARDWQLHLFGGVGHTFTDRTINALGLPGLAYNAAADRRSWAMMCLLLQECFHSQSVGPRGL